MHNICFPWTKMHIPETTGWIIPITCYIDFWAYGVIFNILFSPYWLVYGPNIHWCWTVTTSDLWEEQWQYGSFCYNIFILYFHFMDRSQYHFKVLHPERIIQIVTHMHKSEHHFHRLSDIYFLKLFPFSVEVIIQSYGIVSWGNHSECGLSWGPTWINSHCS